MDPPGYRYTPSTKVACQYCIHVRNINLLATCSKYECRTLLDSVCISFEAIGDHAKPFPTPDEIARLDGPSMKYPART